MLDKLAKALNQECGPYLPLGFNKTPVVENWIDMDTFKEETDYTADWMANCVSYLTKTEPWDIVMLKWHSPDHVKHAFWNKIDPLRHDFDPSKAEEGWDIFRWNYQSVEVGRKNSRFCRRRSFGDHRVGSWTYRSLVFHHDE